MPFAMPLASADVLILSLVIGYLCGSVPFGLLLTRAAGLGDIRQIGSGNIGATNVLRTGRKGLAAATLALDLLKGVAGVVLGGLAYGAFAEPSIADTGVGGILGGLGAFLGHLFPVWLKFRGGKGVATYIGVALGLAWPLALVFCGVWLAVAGLSRMSSLSALVASVAAPVAAAFTGRPEIASLLAVMSLLLIVKHRANIGRLLKGQEPRIGA